ncbi:MAG: hypothetical protein GTO24_25920 [candidate division Zixibacteria bacterium]|nr:hypothetical protein [candidate division Zixibacteria bacterium]
MRRSKILILLAWIGILAFGAIPAMAEMIADTAWVRRYNGPGNSGDWAYAVAVDDSGYAYVTGESYGGVTPANDYMTAKYYQNGDTAWVRRYNGPGSARDAAHAIAVDASGNVYVTGESWGSGTGQDFATIKYHPNGDTAWVRRYGRAGNYDDGAYAMALDDDGNVYVTGYSFGTSINSDYLTIKYRPNGDTAWVRTYDGPGNRWDEAYAIAVDDFGNIYLTGDSWGDGTLQDYATVKYDLDGNELWAERYDGPGSGEDRTCSIAVDHSGNIYVTGQSNASDGNDDYATIKYYPSGDTAWVRRYNGPANLDDGAFALAVDASGNVHVTGASVGGGIAGDYATIKYNPSGDTLWVRRYNGPGNANDLASAVAVDDSGNVYVSGRSYGDGTSYDYATVKYDAEGNELWIQRYNGPANQYDYVYAMALDDRGNVYVAGGSMGSGTSEDYATIKYLQALRGDANGDGTIDPGDVVYLINYFFRNGPAPVPLDAGDANSDGTVAPADVVYLINYLFRQGPPPGGFKG